MLADANVVVTAPASAAVVVVLTIVVAVVVHADLDKYDCTRLLNVVKKLQ